MKLKTLIHRNIRKKLYRAFHFNPLVEKWGATLQRRNALHLPEIGLSVPVTRGDVLIDCGANVGEVTSRMAKTGATVYAFEPDPYAYAVLARRFSLLSNVHCLNQGVMAQPGILDFYLFGSSAKDQIDSSVGSSFVQEKNEAHSGGVVQITCVDFSEFVRSLAQPVAFVKMDIEGAEVEVLNSLIDSRAIDRIEHILVETHETQIPALAEGMAALRQRIASQGLQDKIRLDWM